MAATDFLEDIYGGATTGLGGAAMLKGAGYSNPYLLAASFTAPIAYTGIKSLMGPSKAERMQGKLGDMNLRLGEQEIAMGNMNLQQARQQQRDQREAEKRRKSFQGMFSNRMKAYQAVRGI